MLGCVAGMGPQVGRKWGWVSQSWDCRQWQHRARALGTGTICCPHAPAMGHWFTGQGHGEQIATVTQALALCCHYLMIPALASSANPTSCLPMAPSQPPAKHRGDSLKEFWWAVVQRRRVTDQEDWQGAQPGSQDGAVRGQEAVPGARSGLLGWWHCGTRAWGRVAIHSSHAPVHRTCAHCKGI